MAFDREGAETFTERVDRDLALFFQGRAAEIARFESRLALLKRQSESGEVPSSLGLVYQGAPGCGKTSLVNHLAKRHADVLFVSVEKRHFDETADLAARIREVAIGASTLFQSIRQAIEVGLGLLRAKDLNRSAAESIGFAAARRALVAVHMDEAQTLGARQEAGLVSLQRGTLGIPALPLFTGLSHTETILKQIPGMSRLADDAVVNMGAMADGECVDSTLMMLEQLGVESSAADARQTAQFIATLARGWPQHLNRAQVALCRELVHTDGRLDAVNNSAVQRESDRARQAYYRGRLDGSVLDRRPVLAAQVVKRLDDVQPYDRLDLEAMCAEEMDRLGLGEAEGFAPNAYIEAMIERGVLSARGDRTFGVAIPSMRTWLLDQYGSPAATTRRPRRRAGAARPDD